MHKHSSQKYHHSLHFNEDGAKRQDTSQQHDIEGLHEPLLLRDGFGHSVDPTRVVRLTGYVTSHYSAHQVQGQDHKQANTHHRYLGQKEK